MNKLIDRKRSIEIERRIRDKVNECEKFKQTDIENGFESRVRDRERDCEQIC